MNNEITANKHISSILSLLQNSGIKVSEPVKAQYCYEADLKSGTEKAKIRVYFGSKGLKTVIQGNKTSKLYKDIESTVFGDKLFETKEEFTEPEEYIGTDESGKGDFFGPLIIAGVHITSDLVAQLKSAGVRDSKLIPDSLIGGIADQIIKIVNGRYSIVFISPIKYNELYKNFGNLNKLLAWGHSRAIENILEEHVSGTVISDKFGNESLIRNSLMEKGKSVKLLQYHKAEKYAAVASASILARNELNKWFSSQSKKLGLVIPKGASGIVDNIAGELIKKFGSEILPELTKTHFKTTKKLQG